MKYFGLQREKERGLILRLPWFQATLLFGKEIEITTAKVETTFQPDERKWFDEQMEAIRKGERANPVMMTAMERHEETRRISRKLDWGNDFRDSQGTLAAFTAIAESAHPRGGAVGFLSVLSVEEREELRQIIRKELKCAELGLHDASESGENNENQI